MRSSLDELVAGARLDVAVLLAAHGSDSDPAINASIRALGDRVRSAGFAEVGVGFHRGEPSFAGAFDQFVRREVVVVPVMTSRGYYSDVVLPREIARREDGEKWTVHYTEPLGAHPELQAIIARRLAALRASLSLGRFAVAVVGHGTHRHPNSRETAVELAAALSDVDGCLEARAFFLDDEPSVDDVVSWLLGTDIVVVPFFVTAGRHATGDLDRRLGASSGDRQRPYETSSGGRRLIIDRTLGDYDEIVGLVVDLARRPRRQQRRAPSAAPTAS